MVPFVTQPVFVGGVILPTAREVDGESPFCSELHYRRRCQLLS